MKQPGPAHEENTKTGLLVRTPIFSRLPEHEVLVIASLSESIAFPSGETIFAEGETGDALFVVERGEIAVNRRTEDGKTIDLARFLPGDLFGELELLNGAPRTADAYAAEDAVLLRFPKRGVRFEDVLKDYPAISAKVLHQFLVVVAGRIRNTNNLIKENSPVIQELKNQVYRDKLTGLFNKTYLEEHLRGILKEGGPSTGLLMIKPDNYKQINDTYGHEAGDRTLQIMAQALQGTMGTSDVAVRFMGNELSLVLPGKNRETARISAVEVQRLMNNLDLSAVTGTADFSLSVSIGIAVYPDPLAPDEPASGERLIERAHELPLIGRARGGNKILFPEDKEAGGSR